MVTAVDICAFRTASFICGDNKCRAMFSKKKKKSKDRQEQNDLMRETARHAKKPWVADRLSRIRGKMDPPIIFVGDN